MTQDESLVFGNLLRRHRIFAGMSQEELAARAGLSARAISDLERGVKRVPRRDTVQLLIEALTLSGDERAAFVAAAREPALRPGATSSARVQISAEEESSARATLHHSGPAVRIPPATIMPPVGGFLGAAPQGPLIGRDEDLAAVLTAFDAVAQGTGRMVAVSGEPGVGKTRLAQEITLAGRDQGFLVATGRCYEPHRVVPYYPFLEALSPMYAAAPDAVREETSVRWPAFMRLLPDQPAASSPASAGSLQDEQQRLLWAVTGFLQSLAEIAPVALLTDDLHWADDASLALLQHLARHTRSHRILLLGVYRDVDVGRRHPLGKALHDLEREHLVDRVTLRLLGPDETAHLIAARIGQGMSEDLNGLIYRHTDGNPLFVQEVLGALIERGDIYRRNGRWERKDIATIAVPESVRATIADRISRLSEPAQDALHQASVLGQAFTFETLQAMGEHSEEMLDAALDEALAAGLLQETRDGYVFNHALTQQTLYTELPSRRRRKLHLAAGEAQERLPERTLRQRAAELAWHFREGGAPERSLPYALLAGDYASSMYATTEAEQHYRTALDLAESLEDHTGEACACEKLGWLMWLLARFDVSAEMLERAANEYRALADDDGEMRAVGLLGMLFYTVEPLEGVRRISAFLDRFGGSEPSRALASLYVSLALNLLIAGRYPETAAAAERGAEISRALGDTRMVIWAEMTRGPALGLMGRLDEARRLGEETIPVAEAIDDYYGVLSAVHYLGGMCLAEGDFTAAQDYYGRALKLAERLGAQSRISAESANLAEVLFYLGEWERARDLAARALHIARAESSGRTGAYFQYANVFRQLGMIYAAMGEWEVARTHLEEAVARAKQLPYPEALRSSQGLLAEHELARGHPDVALAQLEPLIEGSDTGEMGIIRLLPTLARAHAELGDFADAERVLNDGIERATAQRHRLALVDLLRTRGTILGMQGQDRREEAERALDEAIALARNMGYPYAEGRALFEQGCLFIHTHDRSSAREPLLEAFAIFQRLGAQPDADRVDRALVEPGSSRLI